MASDSIGTAYRRVRPYPCIMDTSTSAPTATPAALPYRLLAIVYDLLPLLALWFAVAAIALLVRGGVPVTPNSPAAFVEFACMLLVAFAYLCISWRRGGQTLGMRAWR